MEVKTLAKKYGFRLIPNPTDYPEVAEAGYTLEDTNRVSVMGRPCYDKKRFYYLAYAGSVDTGTNKPSILMCRDKKTGNIIYARNCNKYTMDTAQSTYLGPKRVTCRTGPVLIGDRLYLVNGSPSNIGPELYCLSKRGDLIYSIAYYIPEELEADIGVGYLTNTVGDYSKYVGTNSRVCTHVPLVVPGKCNGDNIIYVGSSSLQNLFNVGVTPGNPNYTSYPWWTDRGNLVKIKEIGGVPSVTSRTFTCAPPLNVGDKLTKSNPVYDPFLPGRNSVIISTVATSALSSPGKGVNGLYYVQQNFTKDGLVFVGDFSFFWTQLGTSIHLTGVEQALSFVEALAILESYPDGNYSLSASLPTDEHIKDAIVSGQKYVSYTKELFVGDVIANKYDANALGYWGNSVWGDKPLLTRKNVVFTSGQSHNIPLDENIFFLSPQYNYRDNKKKLVDLTHLYKNDQSYENLQLLNEEKISFERKMRKYSLAQIRSPRGQMSYSDGVFYTTKDLVQRFAFRSVPSDVFNFFAFFGIPSLIVNDIDGDCSLSAFESCDKNVLGFVSKSGCAISFDVSHLTNAYWKHGSPSDVGVKVLPFRYVGPNGFLGGSNYQAAQSTKTGTILSNTSNSAPVLGGSTGTNPLNYELFVSEEGLYVPPLQSVAYEYDIVSQKITWTTPTLTGATGSSSYYKGYFLTNDYEGNLYAMSEHTGAIEWFLPAGDDAQPLGSGISPAVVDKYTNQVYWLSSYRVPLSTEATAFGWVLESDPELSIEDDDCSGCHEFLNGARYESQNGNIATWYVCRYKGLCFYKLTLGVVEHVVVFKLRGVFRELCHGELRGKFINKNLFKVGDQWFSKVE